MAENLQDKISAFDTFFTSNHIQMLKILLSYVDPVLLQNMSIYIKLSELRYTLDFFRSYKKDKDPFPVRETFDTDKLCQEFLPLCTDPERQRLLHMKQLMDNLKNIRDMMEMMEMMKELFPDGEPFANASSKGNENSNPFSNNFNPLDFFSGMSGFPDLQEFFQNPSHPPNNATHESGS